jgi:uncharacterized membrane protein YhaH (DUF805 family)
MDIETLRAFFLWCTILNTACLALSFVATVVAGDFIYRSHTRFFPMQRETFNAVIYGYLGLYKLLVLVFNLAPYLALLMIG